MEITTITDVINQFALPTALCIIFLMIILKIIKSYKDTMDEQKNDIKEMNNRYHEDIMKFSEVLKDNTDALNNMNKMVELFCRKYDNDDK